MKVLTCRMRANVSCCWKRITHGECVIVCTNAMNLCPHKVLIERGRGRSMKLKDAIGRKVLSVKEQDKGLTIELSGGVRLKAEVTNCAPVEWCGSEGLRVKMRKLPRRKKSENKRR